MSTLKRVPVAALRLGMHLQALGGSWLSHDLWRRRFTLEHEADRYAVVGSGASKCWIDLPQGLDVESSFACGQAPEHAERVVGDSFSAGCDRVPEPSVSFEDELPHAARLCKVANQAVKTLFSDLRTGKALDSDSLLPLVDELSASVLRCPGALVNLARLRTKDDYTYMHSVAVCALMVSVARETGMGVNACREAGLAGLLHDVGKAFMPVEILNKPGELTEEEFGVIRSHPARGYKFLMDSGSAGPTTLDVCLHHHERMDGLGYPDKLRGEQISKMARLAAICDVYDAVTSARPYKTAWDPAVALLQMASWTGHFDPELFAAFVRSLGIYPSGSLVRLRSGRLAVVVKQHPTDSLRPTVKVFFSTRSNFRIPVIEVDLAREDPSDAIAYSESREKWNAIDFDALWTGAVRRL